MRYVFLFLSVELIAFCSGAKNIGGSLTSIRFKENGFLGNEVVKQDYIIDVPKGGKLHKRKNGDSFQEYIIVYNDSSIVYIMNDAWGGSRLNYQNRYKSGILSINKAGDSDTVTIGGMQENGKYWKEYFAGNIEVGYVNADDNRKNQFENSILSLKRRNGD